MQTFPASTHAVMPWKNGGGTTTEIARHPAEASLDDFEWRISLATVATAGPFSRFVGVDRTLAFVEGAGMTLTFAERGAVTLGAGSTPLAFPGELAVAASLSDGATVDFNAMTRRSSWRHFVTRIRPTGPLRLVALGDAALVYVASGSAGPLAHRDAVRLDRGDSVDLAPDAGCEIFVVDLFRA